MTLLSPPIAERSMEVKLASQKWSQLQNMISGDSQAFTDAIDLDMALLGISPSSDNDTPKLPDISSVENKSAQQTKTRLPILSGILRNTDIHGRAYASAVINGHRLKVNDRVEGFKIKKILADGVVVTSSGQSWFLSVPDVAYSRIHAAGAEKNDSQ